MCYVGKKHEEYVSVCVLQLRSFQKGMAYYKSCVDIATINRRGSKPLDDLIREYGSWTITSREWDQNSWNMVEYLALMRRKLSISPFFTAFVGADPRNSSQNIIQVICRDNICKN